MHNEYRSVVSSTAKQVTNRKQSSVGVMGLGVSSAAGYKSDKNYPLGSTDSYRRWVNERNSDSDDIAYHEESDPHQKNVTSQLFLKILIYFVEDMYHFRNLFFRRSTCQIPWITQLTQPNTFN